MMVYHQTKFGYKMFGGLENSIIMQTNINYILCFHCEFDLQNSNPIFSLDIYDLPSK